MIEYLKYFAFAVLALSAINIIKSVKGDFALHARVAATVVLSLAALSVISPILTYIKNFSKDLPISEHTDILIRALGISLVTKAVSDICKDSGENGIGASVENIGKLEILVLCIPLIEKIINDVIYS